MPIREAMAITISNAHPSSTITEVAVIMRREDCGFLPILRDERLEGVVTDRDIVVRVCADGGVEANMRTISIGQIMTHAPICVEADARLEDARRLMAERAVRRLPLLEGARRVGRILRPLQGPASRAVQAAMPASRAIDGDGGVGWAS